MEKDIALIESDHLFEIKPIQEALERAGIPSYIQNEHTQNLFAATRIYGGSDAVVGAYRLMISPADYERAAQLLQLRDATEEELAAGTPEIENDPVAEAEPPRDEPVGESIGRAFLLSGFAFLWVTWPFLFVLFRRLMARHAFAFGVCAVMAAGSFGIVATVAIGFWLIVPYVIINLLAFSAYVHYRGWVRSGSKRDALAVTMIAQFPAAIAIVVWLARRL
jgi:hypothetical protein